MSKNIRITEPSAEMLGKIVRARQAIAEQKQRYIKCPYCQHNAIAVYGYGNGHRNVSDGAVLQAGGFDL